MKRIFLLVILLVFFAELNAQSLSLSYLSGPLANGENVYVNTPLSVEITSHVYVKNNATTSKTVECKKTEIEKVVGSMNYFCWGACYPPNTMLGVLPISIAAGATNTESFSGYYNCQGNGGSTIVRYTFFVVGNASDSISFIVNYTGCSVGIDDPDNKGSVTSAYPNPAKDHITFRISSGDINSGASQLEVSSVLGEECGLFTLSPGSFETTISTASFRPGLYYATLVNNGQRRGSYKFSVSR